MSNRSMASREAEVRYLEQHEDPQVRRGAAVMLEELEMLRSVAEQRASHPVRRSGGTAVGWIVGVAVLVFVVLPLAIGAATLFMARPATDVLQAPKAQKVEFIEMTPAPAPAPAPTPAIAPSPAPTPPPAVPSP